MEELSMLKHLRETFIKSCKEKGLEPLLNKILTSINKEEEK